MKKAFIAIPFAITLVGLVWSKSDHESNAAFVLYLMGWMSFIITVGYVSTPSNSLLGKICFGFVILMSMGIAAKILHFAGGDIIIIVGLSGIIVTYFLWWFGKRTT